MKIVHITTVHPVFDTRIFQRECRGLADRGCDVVLLAPHPDNVGIDGVEIVGLEKFSSRLQRVLIGGYQAFRRALLQRADIYHLHDPELLPWGALLRLCGQNVIFDMHENLPKAILNKQWVRPLLRRFTAQLWQLCERVLLLGVPVVFAEASYAADYRWVKTSAVILNLPRVTDFMPLAERNERRTVGYIGVVSAERGFDVTLQALDRLRAQGVEVDFACVGPLRGEGFEAMTSFEKRWPGALQMHGYLPPEQGWKIVAGSDVGLALLCPTPNYVDSYPTKMFEYMALGLPVIVSDFPLYREVVESCDCGFCVNPEDPSAITEALSFVLEDRDRAKEMGARGRRAVEERYNWDNEERKLLNLYEIVIGRGAQESG